MIVALDAKERHLSSGGWGKLFGRDDTQGLKNMKDLAKHSLEGIMGRESSTGKTQRWKRITFQHMGEK